MMTVMLLILAAILAIMPATAQPQPVECPLPPYQLPLLAPERAFVDEAGDVVISGVDTPFNLPGWPARAAASGGRTTAKCCWCWQPTASLSVSSPIRMAR
ncbi:MAG: hypothetical protein IPK52_19875 [Chloroflexi bacterium]|nr:hypothetical protein [Chloroflexota bacterium]